MRKIEIIAEIGINWNGSMELARELIREAKRAGADVAKFQLRDQRNRKGIEDHPYKEVVLETHLTKRQLYFLKAECDRVDIEFMCSVFDVERVAWYEEVGGKRYKIASNCVHNKELVDAILATGKEVIMSNGYILDNPHLIFPTTIFHFESHRKVLMLYCVSKYPAPLDEITFPTFGSFFNGYSDHTVGITACVMAMSIGARIIEKHFTLDKTLEGPDHLLSAEPNELRRLCLMRDDIERILYR